MTNEKNKTQVKPKDGATMKMQSSVGTFSSTSFVLFVLAFFLVTYTWKWPGDVHLMRHWVLRNVDSNSALISVFSEQYSMSQVVYWKTNIPTSSKLLKLEIEGENSEIKEMSRFENHTSSSCVIDHQNEHMCLIEIGNLESDTRYRYQIFFGKDEQDLQNQIQDFMKDYDASILMAPIYTEENIFHSFETAPRSIFTAKGAHNVNKSLTSSLRFTFGSCIMTEPLFSLKVFDQWATLETQFAIVAGDVVYVDFPPWQPRDGRTYRRLLNDPYFQKLFHKIPLITQYDDHEFFNNYKDGLEAKVFKDGIYYFDKYVGNLVKSSLSQKEKGQFFEHYFHFDWAEYGFFMMDVRAYRSNETLIGRKQMEDLKKWLVNDTSHIWKFVSFK